MYLQVNFQVNILCLKGDNQDYFLNKDMYFWSHFLKVVLNSNTAIHVIYNNFFMRFDTIKLSSSNILETGPDTLNFKTTIRLATFFPFNWLYLQWFTKSQLCAFKLSTPYIFYSYIAWIIKHFFHNTIRGI